MIDELVTTPRPSHHRYENRWWLSFIVTLLLITTASCSEAPESVITNADVADAGPEQLNAADEIPVQPSTPTSESQRAASAQFVEQELNDITSPFTKERVLELNAIVARSLAAIEAFDVARKQLKPDEEKSVQSTLNIYGQLSEQSRLARDDMQTASEDLKRSGEKYSEPIFAAMVHFVDDVEREIREELESLHDRLRPIPM